MTALPLILDARGPRRTVGPAARAILARALLADDVVVLAGDMPPGRPVSPGKHDPAPDPLDATLLRAGRAGLDVYYTPPRVEGRADHQRRHNFELLPSPVDPSVASAPTAPAVAVEPAAPAPAFVEPVDVAALTSRDQLFACTPLRCRLNAGACIDRQALAQAPRDGINKPAYEARRQANNYVACENCPLGRAVAARLAP